MNSDDDFQSLLGDDAQEITPLKVKKRVALKKVKSSDVNVSARKENAQSFAHVDQDPLDSQTLTMVAPLDVLAFQRPGVQHGVYKNLRLGKYAIEAVLDLHRLSVEQARTSLYRFIQDCLDNDVRYGLITHGKGEGRETPALLKSCVAHWLPQMDAVLAYHSAQRHHGSYGATYVLLKKSDAKKLQNKEKFRKGG